jgi:hypothetical protein
VPTAQTNFATPKLAWFFLLFGNSQGLAASGGWNQRKWGALKAIHANRDRPKSLSTRRRGGADMEACLALCVGPFTQSTARPFTGAKFNATNLLGRDRQISPRSKPMVTA